MEAEKTSNVARHAGNALFPVLAGIASFLFSLAALMLLTEANQKIVAAVALGLFCLCIFWIAAERPNGETARATAALVARLLEVGRGDYTSPTPPQVRRVMPSVARAVDHLFAQVRSSIDSARAVAMYDAVTALPNRVHFHQEVERLLDTRAPAVISALMFVDLDRFKAINDNLGHARGDEALAVVAERLCTVADAETARGRPRAIVARLAGDEFTMYFPDLDTPEDAQRVAAAVLAALTRPFDIGGQQMDVGASIGMALCPAHGVDLTTLMRSSDIAMYEAKSSGRGRLCVYDQRLALRFETKSATEADLRAALRDGEFELYFQPQVTPDTGALVAVEALLRWHHPVDGIRLPTTFIPVAEDCGLIIDVGHWVTEAVATTLARWRAGGITTRLALNVSPRQLDRSQFFVHLRETMAHAGADLGQLELEFTETSTMTLGASLLAEIADLRRDGVHIALDDFGTGYSNLARLKEMPLDRIKIDRSLIWDIDTNPDARVIVQGVMQLVHGIGCSAVAEGVETMEQAEMLRLIGCDTLQGFALGEPMAECALLAWMTAREDREDQAAGSMRAITSA